MTFFLDEDDAYRLPNWAYWFTLCLKYPEKWSHLCLLKKQNKKKNFMFVWEEAKCLWRTTWYQWTQSYGHNLMSICWCGGRVGEPVDMRVSYHGKAEFTAFGSIIFTLRFPVLFHQQVFAHYKQARAHTSRRLVLRWVHPCTLRCFPNSP